MILAFQKMTKMIIKYDFPQHVVVLMQGGGTYSMF